MIMHGCILVEKITFIGKSLVIREKSECDPNNFSCRDLRSGAGGNLSWINTESLLPNLLDVALYIVEETKKQRIAYDDEGDVSKKAEK